MAHIYHIPAVVEGSYVDGKRSTHTTVFPKSEVFEGFNAPSRFEGHVLDLEVLGIFRGVLRMLTGRNDS
jgi:carotenoid cleavage dioxygenase